MPKPTSIQVETPDTMECRACGAPMRLFGIEAHPDIGGTHLRSYVCPRCDRVRTQVAPAPARRTAKSVPARSVNGPAHSHAFDAETTRVLCAAFDAAWEAVLASGIPLDDARQASAVRELLAKHIIEMVGRGERNQQQLVENASRLLLRSSSAATEAG
jgi:hypothetical protein